jgi:hypothetical protein
MNDIRRQLVFRERVSEIDRVAWIVFSGAVRGPQFLPGQNSRRGTLSRTGSFVKDAAVGRMAATAAVSDRRPC